MRSRIVAFVAFALVSSWTLCPAQQPAQAAPAGDPAPDIAAARALLDSWKGEIEILEEARRKLEAAWKIDPKNAEAMKVFERYAVIRKEMYAIQRKTRGGPGVAEARKILDSWSGQPEVLARAKAALDKVLASDAYNAYVPIEEARMQMMLGYLNNRPVNNGKIVYSIGNYAPQTIQRAAQTVFNALRYDPLNGDAHVMQGYILHQQGALDAAEKALLQAESKGATDPRRHMYWADVYVARGNYPAAVERVQRALKEEPGDARVMLMSQARLADIYKGSGEADKAIAAYEALVKLEPKDAWIHNNYGAYLSESLGRYDQAIAELRTALRLMDFGIGRRNLATALYGKWADQVAERKADAETYFAEAMKLNPNLDHMMVYGASRPTGERLAKALMSKGVSIDARAEDGTTAVLLATNLNRNPTVKYLLGLDANPNLADKHGWTPLLSAASEGNSEIVNLLLAKGADASATLNGKDAASLAAQYGYPELAASLKQRMTGQK